MCPLLGLLVRPFAGDFNTHWPDSWRHNFNFGFITGWLLSFISSSEALAIESKIARAAFVFFFLLLASRFTFDALIENTWMWYRNLQVEPQNPPRGERRVHLHDEEIATLSPLRFSLSLASSSFWPSCWPHSTSSFSYNTAATRTGCDSHNCSARVPQLRLCVLIRVKG